MTEHEWTALRRLARALIIFSAARAVSPPDEDEEDFLTCLLRISQLEGFNDETRLAEIALDWVRQEFVVCNRSSLYDPSYFDPLCQGVPAMVPHVAGSRSCPRIWSWRV